MCSARGKGYSRSSPPQPRFHLMDHTAQQVSAHEPRESPPLPHALHRISDEAAGGRVLRGIGAADSSHQRGSRKGGLTQGSSRILL